MFMPESFRNLSDEELAAKRDPQEAELKEMIQDELAPEYVAKYIESGYRLECIWQYPLEQYVFDCTDLFNFSNLDTDIIKMKTIQCLNNRYGIKVTSENPLEIEKIQQNS